MTLVKRVYEMNWRAPVPRAVEGHATAIHSVTEVLPSGKRPQLRPCKASWLDANGEIQNTRFLIPAMPLFERAFCAFARGTLLSTQTGPVAIEDLLPGDHIVTADGSAKPITWIGTTTLVPASAPGNLPEVPLYRIMPDAFGMSRPLSHMVAGPSARVPGHSRQTLTTLASFEDGVQITRLRPPSPVEMFHQCLDVHALIRIGGLTFESYHPGHAALSDLGPAMRELFMKLFPQIDHITDFGPMVYPREPDPIDGATAA